MGFARTFLDANRRLSGRVDARKDLQLFARYEREVAAAIGRLPAGSVVVDLGGGRESSFAKELGGSPDVRVIAVDISASELAKNTTAHETRVADVTTELPFADGEVDLLVSRTVLEHVGDVRRATSNIARVLRPGGETLHLVPGRYSLFAVVARRMPFGLAKRTLHFLQPDARGVVEFDVVYDRTHPVGLERMFRDAGFQSVDVSYTWDQADYAAPLFPVFLVVMLYQRLVERLRIRALASYILVRAVR